MTDEELIAHVEALVFYKMLEGCEMDDHLGNKEYNVGAWCVNLRADTLCRLIDMVKKGE